MEIYSEHRKRYVLKLSVMYLIYFVLHQKGASVTTKYWICMQDLKKPSEHGG